MMRASQTAIMAGKWWRPTSIADLKTWWLANDTPEATTPKWGDNSGNDFLLTSPASTKVATYSATAVGGRPGLLFATNDYLLAALASDWIFLHSGTGSTIAITFQTSGVATTQVMLDTSDLSTGVGMYISHDGSNKRIVVQIRNGSGVIYTYTGAANSCLLNVPHILVIRYDTAQATDVDIRLDGVQISSGNVTGTPSSASPQGPLALGARNSGGSVYTGAVQICSIWARFLTNAETTTVESRLPAVRSPRHLRRVWTIGDSITGGASTYRDRLWQRVLNNQFTRFDMLGSSSAGPYTLPNKNTDGYSGDRIDEWATNITTYAPAVTNPTDVLIILGTNDMVDGDGAWGTMAAAPARLQALILALKVYHPSPTYWLGTLPPSTSLTTGPRVITYNAALPAVTAAVGATLVDIFSGLTAADISADLIHPTAAGYDKIGDIWATAMGL